MRERIVEPGIKRSGMRQILHTFRVNRNLPDTCPVYVASEDQRLHNGGLQYRSRFMVLELSRPNGNYVFPAGHLL